MKHMLFILGLFTALAYSEFFISAASAQEKMTTLRVIAQPKGTFRTSNGTVKLTHAETEVKNVGEFEAKNVAVAVITPNGRLSLRGPSTLAPNKEAVYSADAYDYVTSGEKLKPDVQCDNCR